MIDCRRVTELADTLIDGELGLVGRARVHAHLFVCVHCRRYVDQLRSTLSAVRGRGWAEADLDSQERAISLLRAEPASTPTPKS
jgi:predicted anti-sigma-YlaC factor YlaD